MPTTLVIGGSSGIGLAAAVRLSTLGDIVHVAGRDPRRLADAVGTHPALLPHELDAGDADAVAALVADLVEEYGSLDRLIVTLSGNEGVGALAELDLSTLRAAFEEKFWPTLAAVQVVAPHLAPGGSITLVGAVTARVGMPGTAGPGSLNAAVEGLVQPLAAELAPIRVNAVSPGYVDTPWWDMVPQDDRNVLFGEIAETLPTKHIATADDVAEVIVLLATNPNRTGTVVESDGGAHLTA
ncbi:SDR family oxidoreductase [Gordonia jinhuaensis]|uniref:Short-chain dehydrogenase n=1 Tax=Gordonia jinhuaensis TaxID=1517702 RepID=A0A916T6S6_9ACTN|nr:SDR family oxidoreductase [Gordonia jinhuaensis]GGB32657.1 short-chain dehydrogenase [Gordonia jinhuaensis]